MGDIANGRSRKQLVVTHALDQAVQLIFMTHDQTYARKEVFKDEAEAKICPATSFCFQLE